MTLLDVRLLHLSVPGVHEHLLLIHLEHLVLCSHQSRGE